MTSESESPPARQPTPAPLSDASGTDASLVDRDNPANGDNPAVGDSGLASGDNGLASGDDDKVIGPPLPATGEPPLGPGAHTALAGVPMPPPASESPHFPGL